jgi:hypothetical protein
MLRRAVETKTLLEPEEDGSLHASACATAPADVEGTRAAAVNTAAKECGVGRTASVEDIMERKWERAARGWWRESGLRREFHEATSRKAAGMSAKTAKAAPSRGRGREQ